jgi:hypothetical protein
VRAKEILQKLFSGPFSATFGTKVGQYSATDSFGQLFFLRPILSFFTELSATWQHWFSRGGETV